MPTSLINIIPDLCQHHIAPGTIYQLRFGAQLIIRSVIVNFVIKVDDQVQEWEFDSSKVEPDEDLISYDASQE